MSDADLDELGTRLAMTRWLDEPDGIGWSRGVPLEHLQRLTEYWATAFDWRKQESRLDELPQATTSIDGQTIHCGEPLAGRVPAVHRTGAFMRAAPEADPLT